MNARKSLALCSALGVATLLAACSGSDTPSSTAEQAAPPPAASSSTQATVGGGAVGPQQLPSAIVSIEYELDLTPNDDGDDVDKTTTDPAHIAALTELLEQHGITSDYTSDQDDCADEQELEIDARLESGDTLDIDVETCSPTEFEQQLIDLVRTWP